MDPIIKKAFRDKTTWYAKVSEDGAGNVKYVDTPVTDIPCLIDGRAVVTISNMSSRATLYVASRDSGESIKAKYIIYLDYSKYPIAERDDLVIYGKRYPVISVEPYTPIRKKQNTLAVVYV